MNYSPGFFQYVFEHLTNKATTNPFDRDAALMVYGASIKSATVYNASSGFYDGFVDYGPSITLLEYC